MIDEVRLVIPDLLELSGQSADKLSLTFRVEEHLDLASSWPISIASLLQSSKSLLEGGAREAVGSGSDWLSRAAPTPRLLDRPDSPASRRDRAVVSFRGDHAANRRH